MSRSFALLSIRWVAMRFVPTPFVAVLSVLLSVAGLHGVAAAQDEGPPPPQEQGQEEARGAAQPEGEAQGQGATGARLDEAARLTFESARQAFVAGDYETALARFRQAYQLSPRPGLLYNIAQSLDRLRRDEETVQALRDYLAALPDAPNRAEVEARIRVLERELAERQQEQAPPPDEAGPQDTGENTVQPADAGIGMIHPAAFISVAGLTLASAAVLIWSGVQTLSLNDAYLNDGDPATVNASFNAANDQQLLTNVFIGVTAGLGAVAVALAIFTDWSVFGGGGASGGEQASVRPLFVAGPGAGWLGLGGDF